MSNNDNKNLKNAEKININKTPESITKNLFKKAFEEDEKTDTKYTNDNDDFDDDFASDNYKNIIKKYTEDLFSEDDEDDDNEFKEDDVYFEDEYFEDEYLDDVEENNVNEEENYFDTKKAVIDENKYRKKIDKYGNEFFKEEEVDDEKPISIGKVINISIIIILIISTTILAVSLVLTKSKLETLKEENQNLVLKNQDAENKLLQDTLKNKITELEEENAQLQSIVNGENPNNDKTTEQSSNNQSKPQNNGNSSTVSEYTVKEKDSFWKISEAVYGDGAHYKKIIEANNLTENSKLTPGQKLKIPKLK